MMVGEALLGEQFFGVRLDLLGALDGHITVVRDNEKRRFTNILIKSTNTPIILFLNLINLRAQASIFVKIMNI